MRKVGRPRIGAELKFDIEKEVIEALEEMAKVLGLPRAEVVRRILRDAVSEMSTTRKDQ